MRARPAKLNVQGGYFGQEFANIIRRRLPRPGDTWHLDEVVLKIASKTHYLWRAVDQHGVVLDVLVQSRRNKKAAKREIMPGVEHRQHKGLNNRAENSHQPTRRRERQMKRFKSARHVQRFVSIHDPSANLFHFPRNRITATEHRAARSQALDLGRDRRRLAGCVITDQIRAHATILPRANQTPNKLTVPDGLRCAQRAP